MKILQIADFQDAIEKAKEILYEKVDKKTVLFLSGGATPKSLYVALVKDGIIRPAAVGMIDERYGKKMHEASNERMIQETGFLGYLEQNNIPFCPILTNRPRGAIVTHLRGGSNKQLGGEARNEVAQAYDQTTRDLFFHFPKSVAIMGIGSDGHTAGISPSVIPAKAGIQEETTGNRSTVTKPVSSKRLPFYVTDTGIDTNQRIPKDSGSPIRSGMTNKSEFVISYNNPKMVPPERITMTFAGLSLIDFFIVLIFGKEKKKAIRDMFEQGSIEEVPARFFVQQAAEHTVILTDQQI